MSPISKKYKKSNTLTLARFDQTMGAPILLGILFFFVVCLGASDSIKKTVMVVAVFALLVIAVRFKVLRERIHWPFIALTLYVIMDGVSTFYAVSGKFALREFLKVFLAYLLAVILLATSPKKEEVSGKRIATILAVCTAFGSLVSIDLISTRWISGAVTWILGHFTQAYEDLVGVVPGSRITSVFDNSNVFAGFSGLGVLLTMGLADTAENRKGRCLFLVMLYINALAFILAFSMGAILFLMIAFLAFLASQRPEKRAGLLLLILELVILTAVSMAAISRTSFQTWKRVQLVPLLCSLVGAAALCGVDIFGGQRVAARIKIKNRTAVIIIVLLIVLVAAFAFAAMTLTEDIVLAPGETLMRAAYPKSGDYTLNVESEGGQLNVRIRSRSLQQSAMNRDSILYNGLAETVDFSVPEDSKVVYFDFSSESGTHILSADFGGYRIPLKYKLLPSFVAFRLQGVLASHSVTERIEYFKDGYKLFRRSPIIGLGIGSFENAIKGVQSFYYETKYVHNHYFQTMLETGTVGLILFLGLFASAAIAIWKSIKKHIYSPMLGAMMAFMAGQAIHDIIFSAYAYLPVAYGTFAMINLCCGDAIEKPKLTKTVRTAVMGIISVCTIIYCVFISGNLMAKRRATENPTFQTLVQCTRLDRFEWADYALPYVINAKGDNVNPYVRQQADEFAVQLSQVNSNTIPIYLAEYYFTSDRPEQGIAMIEKYLDYVASDQRAWQTAFDLLQTYAEDTELFRNGIARLAQKLETWNAEHAGVIRLDNRAEAFIAEYTAE